ncbi:MAG: Tim44 domain-containing protein [Clostridia bacterium]|nr:Tim44 domain-containing protein [Clostridia bacterium]
MKKFFAFTLLFGLLLSGVHFFVLLTSIDVSAAQTPIMVLRAGGGEGGSSGGGSSGGSGSSGSSRRSSSSRTHYRSSSASPLESIMYLLLYPIFAGVSALVFALQLTKRARKAKKLMKQMAQSDNAWKFNSLNATVRESFYAIQAAWSNMDMSPAAIYMSEDLRNSFQTKLNWMEFKHQKNILKKIRLIDALPVAVHDNADNTCDHVWFYIKGKMVDYMLDTQTQMKISGSTHPTKFVEYWQFVRTENTWVLNKILQKNEANQIVFTA